MVGIADGNMDGKMVDDEGTAVGMIDGGIVGGAELGLAVGVTVGTRVEGMRLGLAEVGIRVDGI